MNKRLLSLIVAVIFVLGTIATGFAAELPDIVDTEFEDGVNRLVALDIIDGFPDGTYRPGEPVTREQFAKIVVAATGVGAAAEYAKGATDFVDVGADRWSAGYIKVATDLGIIQGYGDGTFRPAANVTYAEAITMIVRSLGYEPAAQAKGGYPGGYLAIAAEKEITDGVTVLANVAANRGDIAIMVDNSLEVDMMVQDSYGDKPTWKEKEGETLLKKLGVDEIEGKVLEIARVNDKLEDNEIVVEYEENDKEKTKTYELVTKDTPEALFGLAVKLLVKDDKVVHVEIDTDAKDILIDTIADVNDDTIELKVKDKEYDLAADALVYVNFDEGDPDVGMYGTFILDGKEIKFANLFDFEYSGLVTKVAKDEIEYAALAGGDEDVLEIDKYDDVYVYNKDFTAATLDDIDKNSLIYYWEDGDDAVFIVVVNEVVKGEVTRAREDSVTIDGKKYDLAEEAIMSTDAGEEFEEADATELLEEKVVLYLDLNGEVAAIVGEADITSDTLYGIATWCDTNARKPVITIFTAEGKEVDYYFDDKDDAKELGDVTDEDGNYAVVSYKLNSDGEIKEGSLRGVKEVGGANDGTTNDGSEFPANADDIGKYTLTKEADKKYVKKYVENNNDKKFYITKDTVIMKALDGTSVDPEVIKYEDFIKIDFEENGEAIVFGEENKNADFIVFIDLAFKGVQDDVYFGVVTDDPWKVKASGDDWKAEIDVFKEGKADFKLDEDDKDNFAKGTLVAFKLDSKDKVDKYEYATVAGVVYGDNNNNALGDDAKLVKGKITDVDGSFITVENADTYKDTYKVLDGAVLYKVKYDTKFKLDGTTRIRKSNADNGDQIILLFDKDGVKAALVNPTGESW